MSTLGLVRVLVVVVRVPVECYGPMSILLPATSHAALVVGVVVACFLLVGCPISVVETTLTTNEQRFSSLVSLVLVATNLLILILKIQVSPNLDLYPPFMSQIYYGEGEKLNMEGNG